MAHFGIIQRRKGNKKLRYNINDGTPISVLALEANMTLRELKQSDYKMKIIKDMGMQYQTNKSSLKRRMAIFECECGSEHRAQASDVKRGHVSRCRKCSFKKRGQKLITHGLSKHKCFPTWHNMMRRCYNESHNGYEIHRSRGISVCEEWHDISIFKVWFDTNFKEGLSIDRINNNGNYEPSNCRFATQTIQSRNTTSHYVNNTSGYRGVYKASSKKGTWRAQISLKHKSVHIGNFNNKIDAAVAYNNYIIYNNLEHTLNDADWILKRTKDRKK